MSLLREDSDKEAKVHVKLGQDPKVDWFHFETRMRAVIQEMIEPVIK